MEYIILFVYLILFVTFIVKGKFFAATKLSKQLLLFLFAFRLLFTIAFYAYYAKVGKPLDSEGLYKSSQELYKLSFENPKMFFSLMTGLPIDASYNEQTGTTYSDAWQKLYEYNLINENRTVIRINALLNFFSFQFYKVHLLMMSFLAFCGSVLLYRFFNPQNKKNSYLILFACFCIPSTLFWTSGVLKEPLFFFFLSVFLFYLDKIPLKKGIHVILFLLSMVCMIWTKLYMAGIVIPLSVVYVFCKYYNKHLIMKYISFLFIGFIMLITFHFFAYDTPVDLITSLIEKNNAFISVEKFIKQSNETEIYLPYLEDNFLSFANAIPIALFNVLTQPALQITDIAHILSGMETLFFLLLFFRIWILIYRKQINNKWLFCFFCCFLIFLVIGLYTPNVGAMQRYKSICLPFFTYICCFGTKEHKNISKNSTEE